MCVLSFFSADALICTKRASKGMLAYATLLAKTFVRTHLGCCVRIAVPVEGTSMSMLYTIA